MVAPSDGVDFRVALFWASLYLASDGGKKGVPGDRGELAACMVAAFLHMCGNDPTDNVRWEFRKSLSRWEIRADERLAKLRGLTGISEAVFFTSMLHLLKYREMPSEEGPKLLVSEVQEILSLSGYAWGSNLVMFSVVDMEDAKRYLASLSPELQKLCRTYSQFVSRYFDQMMALPVEVKFGADIRLMQRNG